ncbi:fatty acid hydroxylase superfamily [Striga asiatica]|uniref:Fatty acid hydroxylase superfamily n=1 Tax=Striga asiatica TaxID=4170 RepID=A0A5A7Q633_STRAF|nr:fatty acid hydroxylase superfamily [Striga asiatica]
MIRSNLETPSNCKQLPFNEIEIDILILHSCLAVLVRSRVFVDPLFRRYLPEPYNVGAIEVGSAYFDMAGRKWIGRILASVAIFNFRKIKIEVLLSGSAWSEVDYVQCLMERTEPALVPEWLRCTGNVAASGTSAHHKDTSSMHSPRSRTVRSNSEKDSSRFLGRSSLTDSRRNSSSNGSEKHPYSSFTRNPRNRNRAREKEKAFPNDIWDHGSLDPLESILTRGVERIGFRRSQSLVTRKPGEVATRTVEDSKKPRQSSSNPSGVQNSGLERDFPALGTEEKQGVIGNSRVPSSGLSSAVHSLPIGNSGFLGGEKWTSALAEVPAALVSNGVGHSHAQQNVVTSCPGGLNMAEALSQPPAQVRAAPQMPDKSQRLEELAIKQSRQLIPMTPSMSKPLSLNSGDKSKQPKIAVKANEMSKGVQPQPHSPHLSNHSHAGKFLVLKPGRENTSTSSGDANYKVHNGPGPNSPSTPTASMSPKNSMVSNLDDKVAALSVNSKSNVEKRSPQSMTQSRSEFFNLMRRKSMPNTTTSLSDSSPAVSSVSEEIIKEGCAPEIRNPFENGGQIICNGNGHYSPEKSESCADKEKKNMFSDGQLCPDEEEAAFLRSLGWEENGGEDEGLTEEEINAFYQEYMKRRPSLKVRINSLPKCSTLPAISSSESSSSESED